MTAVDLPGLMERLPAKATLDPVTGQVSYGNGLRICYHAARTETVRESVHRERRKVRTGNRWSLRWTRRPVRVLTLRCPDCPAFQEHIVPAGLTVRAALAPYVFPRESA